MEGRLRGDVRHPDYIFLSPDLDRYYHRMKPVTGQWVNDQGVSQEINWAWDEFEVVRRLVPGLVGATEYDSALMTLTAASNEELFGLIEESSLSFEQGGLSAPDIEQARSSCQLIRSRLLELRNAFFLRNASMLTDTLRRDIVRGPVMTPQVH
jgi:anaerobic magnesium-protoporphyrin IX monomethyl ester cyclase